MRELPDLNVLVAGLDAYGPGYLPQPLFHAIARLVVTPTFVVVPLVRVGGGIRVHLTRRAADDAHYPGLLHPAGTVVLADDAGLEGAFSRLMARELSGLRRASGPHLAGVVQDQITRGVELSLIHWVALDPASLPAALYEVNHLPSDVIATDLPRIAMAAAHFGRHCR